MSVSRAFGLLAVLLLGPGGVDAVQPPCPSRAGALTVFVDNRSADGEVSISVTGDLIDPAATCTGGGATSYATSFTCSGSGLARCGDVPGLRPGAWVHRLVTTVAGSELTSRAVPV